MDTLTNTAYIGANIRRIRKASDLTQLQVSQRATMRRSYYVQIENGKVKNIGTAALQRIADALGCHIKEFFE